MVRAALAASHTSLYARSTARRDSAGGAGAVHALFAALASAGLARIRPAPRRRAGSGCRATSARRVLGGSGIVGERSAAGAREELFPADAGPAVCRRAHRLDAAGGDEQR